MSDPRSYVGLKEQALRYGFNEEEISGLRRVYEHGLLLYARTHKKPNQGDTAAYIGYLSQRYTDAAGFAQLYTKRVLDLRHETKP